MMLAISTNPVVRSSLEEMLESLQRKDELFENPENCKPPSLPARPKPSSRARPPSSIKRQIPADSDIALRPKREMSSDLNNGWEKSIFRFQAKEVETGELREPISTSASDMGGDSGPENGTCGLLNDEAQSALQGTLHSNLHDLEVATTSQSYVRGEIACKKFRSNKSHCDKQDQHLVAAVLIIQSVIRGWFVRRQQHLTRLQSPKSPPFKAHQPGLVEELQKRLLMAEAELGEKDKEITVLKEQVDQLQSKMKAMEEMWQKKIDFLQMSLDIAKRNAVDPGTEMQKHKTGVRSPPRSYNSEETSLGSLTPGCGSPIRFMDILFRENNASASTLNAIVPLVNEFEQQKQLFDLEAQAIVEAKRHHHSPSAPKPLEEVQTLKDKFDAWKKDFGFRLTEAKAKASRMGQQEGEKQKWKWWGLKRRRS